MPKNIDLEYIIIIIRDEFEEEIDQGKISCVEYLDEKGEKRPQFELTLEQCKQVLMRESKYVRRGIFEYIHKIEIYKIWDIFGVYRV